MKHIASVFAAGVLAFTLVASTHAESADRFEANAQLQADIGAAGVLPGEHPHHPCHGRASGTAHHSCGTLTGGPAGGLF